MPSTAIYARYSTDLQNDASIEDQVRLCKEYAERNNLSVAEVYTDHGISGTTMNRPGMQSMMSDAAKGKFSFIISEALDRISRDQEDIAGIYKRVSFEGIQIHTLSEGPVNELHIGLKGTMGALFIKDLADKTRRGMRGNVEAGKSGGGKAYGYDMPRTFDARGELIRGDRTINEIEADTITDIFNRYASGESPRSIAMDLNAKGIKGPTSKGWGQSTINGNAKRGTGILNNELYIGRMIWNRLKYIKDPETGKRVSRLNDESEWIIKGVPELRIIDDALWKRVKDRQKVQSQTSFAQGHSKRLCDHNRPAYILSGLVKCGVCGGGMINVNSDRTGCANARNKGTCSNRKTIKRTALEKHVFDGLKNHLLHPEMFAKFCEVYTEHLNTLRSQKNAAYNAAVSELQTTKRDQEKLIDAILNGIPAEHVKGRLDSLKEHQDELENIIANHTPEPVVLHPAMAQHYQKNISNLIEALAKPEFKAQASDAIRKLIERITLTPSTEGNNKPYIIEVQGVLADILNLALDSDTQEKRPLSESDLNPSIALVAGVGFEPTTFRL